MNQDYKIYDWVFHWDEGRSHHTLKLYNRTCHQAHQIAEAMGWRPNLWYRPSTWGNSFSHWVSDIQVDYIAKNCL